MASASPNLKLLNIYGATEVGADVTYTIVNDQDLEHDAAPYVSAGQSLPGCRITIASQQTDGTWREAKEGELVVTGCQVAAGYLSTPGHHDETLRDGLVFQTQSGFFWMTALMNSKFRFSKTQQQQQQDSIWCFRTGDMARRNENGQFSILGRRDQNVKIRGHKVSLLEVEAAFRSADLNGVVVIIPWGDNEGENEVILAALVSCGLYSKGSCSCQITPSHSVHECRKCEVSIRRQLRQQLRLAAIPQRILFGTYLPKLSSGKVDRCHVKELLTSKLSKFFSEQSSIVPNLQDDPFSQDSWLQWFIGQFQALLGVPVTPNDNFFECGGSSITCIRLLSHLRTLVDGLGLDHYSGSLIDGFLQEIERNATPIDLAKQMIVRIEYVPNGDGRTLLFCRPSMFKVEILKSADIDELSQLAADAFCNREPLTCALLNHPKRAILFRTQIQHLCKDLVDEGLSFVARKKACEHGCEDGGCCGGMLGFSLARSVECDSQHSSRCGNCILQNSALRCLLQGVLCMGSFPQLPELKPADDLYKELFDRWCSWRDTELDNNECVQIMLSGAAEACDYGATVVSACEAAVLDAARVSGFRVAYTINSNAVTEYIATELGMSRRVAIQTVPFLRTHGVSALQVSRLQRKLSDEKHQVALYDIFIGFDGRVDAADAVGTISLRLVELRTNPGTAEKVDSVIETAFRYYRGGDISREIRHLQCRDGQALVLENATNGSIIGCAIIFFHKTTTGNQTAELLLLAVEPKQRGRGASKRILAEIIRLGRREGWIHVFLHANVAMRHIYESNGFEEANAEIASELSLLVSNDEDDHDKRAKVETGNERIATLFHVDFR
jgi:N-acetylglutamate synthase-like GNAT family acetyltransferase